MKSIMHHRGRLLPALLACLLLCPALPARRAAAAEDGAVAALRLTISRHPAVLGKLDELRALGFELESAESLRYPTLSLQASTTGTVAGSSAASTTGDQYHAMVAVLRQPLWVGGRIDGSIDQATVRQRAGKLSLLALQRQLLENTAATYATIQGTRRRIKAAERNVQEHVRLKTLIATREQGGIASRADVNLASSRLHQAAIQLLQLEAALQRSQNELRSLTQQPLPASLPVPDELLLLPPHSRIADDVEKASAVVEQRLQDVELARTAADLATADMLPSLYARMEQDLFTQAGSRSLPQGTRLGVVLEGTVEGLGFSGWKRVKSAGSRVESAKRDVETARTEVRRQAQSLVIELKSLDTIIRNNEALVTFNEETLASFMRQYDAGRKSWVDVLNAQRELSDARLALEQTRSSHQEGSLRLAAQLGQLDSPAGVIR